MTTTEAMIVKLFPVYYLISLIGNIKKYARNKKIEYDTQIMYELKMQNRMNFTR